MWSKNKKHFIVHVVHSAHIVHNDFRNLAVDLGYFGEMLFFYFYYLYRLLEALSLRVELEVCLIRTSQ